MSALLSPVQVRARAEELGLRPTKQLGQNFVIDPNTVRRIVRLAGVGQEDVVLEVGPGLGSLTLALLPEVSRVVAVEIDPVLAGALPETVRALQPENAARLDAIEGDAMRVGALPHAPTALVANLPYNVAVPVLLHALATYPTLRSALVMVQAEVADRLAADPGSKVYGVPSVKARWFGVVRSVGRVPATVFWPVPRVESGLVHITCEPPPAGVARADVFAVVDAAFGQRRKSLRAALAGWAGSPAVAEAVLKVAGVDPSARGEQLSLADFVRIAAARGAVV